MLRNVGIAGKLALMLLLPMVGLAYFAGSKVLDKAETASAAGRLQHDTQLAVRVSAFVHEFQKERGLTALFVGSKGAKSGPELKAQRALTDRRLAALTAGGESAAAKGLSGALASLDKLDGHRSAVDALSLPGPQATAYYTKVNAAMLDVVSSVAGSSRVPALTRGVEAYSSYLRAKEQTGLERAALAKGFTAGSFQDGADIARFLSAVAGQEAYLQGFARDADAGRRARGRSDRARHGRRRRRAVA